MWKMGKHQEVENDVMEVRKVEESRGMCSRKVGKWKEEWCNGR